MTRIVDGDKLEFRVAFTDEDTGDPADPTTVIFSIQRIGPIPAGAITEYTWPTDPEVVRESVGVFSTRFAVRPGGTWAYRYEGTGLVEKAEQANFYVIPAQPARS